MRSAVIGPVKCDKKRFKRNDIHVIIFGAQGPVAIRLRIHMKGVLDNRANPSMPRRRSL